MTDQTPYSPEEDAWPSGEAEEGPGRKPREPHNHRTVDRVTKIVEEVVCNPGMTFAELARALQAPKSSVYGFIQGLLAKGWLYEQSRRFYLGPAVYGLTLASGHVRAGLVSHEDLARLHEETGVPAFLSVAAGEHVISIAEAGSDAIVDYEARSHIRRTLLATAAGKVLLAMRPHAEIQTYLRARDTSEQEMVTQFLGEYQAIREKGLATNVRLAGTRFAVAAAIRNKAGEAAAAVTLVGRTELIEPREAELSELLLKRVATWSHKSVNVREAM